MRAMLLMGFVGVFLVGASADEPIKDADRIAVDAWLSKIPGSDQAIVRKVDSEYIRSALPGRAFYSVRFQRYPRANLIPKSLDFENLVMVTEGQKVERLEVKDLEQLVRQEAGKIEPISKDDWRPMDSLLFATAKLAEAFWDDGAFVFRPDKPRFSGSLNFGISYTISSSVVAGGRGQIIVSLELHDLVKYTDPLGRLRIEGRVRPDGRPR